MYVLVSDIGATNARFAIVHNNEVVYKEVVATSSVSSLAQVVNAFLSRAANHGFTTSKGMFAAAGLHSTNRISLTNASLVVDKHELLLQTALSDVVLCNDVFALASAYPGCVVVSVGTGLGVASSTSAFEAGHLFFAAMNTDEERLRRWLASRLSRPVEYEDLLSGRGWILLYQFFRETQFPSAADIRTPSKLSLLRESTSCSARTAHFFSRILRRFCREMQVLTGCDKVVLAGGVLQKNPFLISQESSVLVRDEDAVLLAASRLIS